MIAQQPGFILRGDGDVAIDAEEGSMLRYDEQAALPDVVDWCGAERHCIGFTAGLDNLPPDGWDRLRVASYCCHAAVRSSRQQITFTKWAPPARAPWPHRLHPDRSPLPSSIDAFEPRLGYIVGGLEIHSGFLSLERAQMWCADDAPRCAGFTTMAPMPGAPRATELFVRFSSSSEVVHHGGWYAWVRADRGDSAKEEL